MQVEHISVQIMQLTPELSSGVGLQFPGGKTVNMPVAPITISSDEEPLNIDDLLLEDSGSCCASNDDDDDALVPPATASSQFGSKRTSAVPSQAKKRRKSL